MQCKHHRDATGNTSPTPEPASTRGRPPACLSHPAGSLVGVTLLTTTRSFEALLRSAASVGELAHIEHLPARRARHGILHDPLPVRLSELLPAVESLWSHQATAIDLARFGRSVVLATGTASGKSLAYQVPIAADALERRGRATSLLLFPTKALAQDQFRALAGLGVPGLVPVTYDGDTPPDARQWARRHATSVLTNPDMLHAGILPFHSRWATFLKRLRYVVIDELHVYRGIFGTHLAQILRRLRRVCASYGSTPVFVFASATIGSPGALAAELAATDVDVVDDDGSPQGERLVAVWRPQPPYEGAPASANHATATLLAELVGDGHRAIAFTRSRRGTEVVAARTRHLLDDDLAETVRPYRGGYLPAERRAIEHALFDGSLRGVVATSALELGVDIGGLDACICNGFPGTIASFRQQIGRAGRSAQRSLAVLVTGDDALDQWYGDHPGELFRRSAEPVVINTANPFVLTPHLACAAHELPLVAADADTWALGTDTPVDMCTDQSTHAAESPDGSVDTRLGTAGVAEAFDDAIRSLVLHDELTIVNGRAVYAGRGSPASRISLRSSGGAEMRIVDRHARLIGTVDAARALSTLHPGALYLHQGQQYRVERLDLGDRAAWVTAVNVDEYTQVRSTADVSFVGAHIGVSVGRLRLSLGGVEVTEQVVGYQRWRISSGEVLGLEPLDLPPTTLHTRAFWYEIPDDVLCDAGLDGASGGRVPGALHAAEHTGIAMLPLFAICDRWDVGGLSTAAHAQTGEATIVIYDGYPGGAGVAELGYAAGRRHLEATCAALEACGCEGGCPSCVQSPKCGNGNEPLDKHGAIAMLIAALVD